MALVVPVSADWLVLLVDGYAPQAQQAAGGDAVSAARVDQVQPVLAARVVDADKRRLAEDLWRVFGGSTLDQRIAALDALLAASDLSPHVDADGRLTWSTRHHEPVDVLTASCVASLLMAVTTHGWTRMGTCAGCDCVDVYVDRAGQGRRKYCSATCLNRAKVRAFRARQAPSSG